MKKLILPLLVVASFSINAQTVNHEAHHTTAAKPSVSLENKEATFTTAVIKKIDKENSKITLTHEEIKNLDMPGMTMVFKLKLKDLSILKTLKVGDSIKADIDKTTEGFIVKEIVKNN